MKKLTIENLVIIINKEKTQIISLENKKEKYILYSNINLEI